MPNNNIELITTYSTKYWDLVYKQEAVTSILDANPKMVKFEGAKTVKIAKFQNGGLNNYYRNNNANGFGDTRVDQVPGSGTNFLGASDFGYQKSPARLVWEEFTMKCDRAAAYEIEYFDNEESGDELVGMGVTEISRTSIIPEVDAYCLSTIAGNALPEAIVSEDITTTPLAALNRSFVWFDNHEIKADDVVVFCSPTFLNALRNTQEVTKFLTQEDFNAQKDIKFLITKYEGRTLVQVSPERLRTNINLYDGGYNWPSATSEAINFLAVAKSAVMHVVKYEKVKVISGETNLAARGFDGYTIFARIYHDVFVPDNKKVAIYLSKPQTAVAAPTVIPTITYDAKNVVKSVNANPGNVLCFLGYSSADPDHAYNAGDTISDFVKLEVGATLTSNTAYAIYCVDSAKKVIGSGKQTFTSHTIQ